MPRAVTILIAAALGAVLALGVCEVLLRWLPVQNGLFNGDPSPDWQVRRLVPNARYTYSDAWNFRNVRHGMTNNMGYAAPFDYVRGSPGIAVIGDSFVQGLMNWYADTLQGQLARKLPTAPPMLNFGTSGASLPDYIGLGPMVSARYPLRWVIVLIVSGDFVEGFGAGPGLFRWNPHEMPPVHLTPEPAPGRSAKLLRTLALVRYTRGNLKLNLHHLLHTSIQGGAASPCTPEALQPGDSPLLEAYAAELPGAYAVAASRVILIFDADRQELYRSNGADATTPCPTRDSLARDALAEAARARGENVIEMAPIFTAYFRATGAPVDYSPIDWHWNAEGNRLAAEAVARIIVRAEPRSH